MPRRLIVFAVLATALAALFVRLGVWQLARHEERKALNAARAAPLAQPPVPFDSAARTSYRHVTLNGTPDHANAFVLSGRSRNGTPGVHLFTPFRRPGSDTAVLVNRGWVYAPDAATADVGRFREPGSAVQGLTDTIPAGSAVVDTTRPRTLRRLTASGVAALLPYPVSLTYVISRDSGGTDRPARLPEPQLTNGPHLGYAVQWFSFAFIGIAGTALVLYRARRGERAGSTAAMKGGTRQS